jgi:hypothetical protein
VISSRATATWQLRWNAATRRRSQPVLRTDQLTRASLPSPSLPSAGLMKKDEKTRTISCPIHASIASSKRGWRQTSSQPVERVCGSPRYLPHTIFTLTSSPNSAEFQCQVDQWPSKRYLELIFLGTSGDPVCRRRGAPASRRLPCPKTDGGRRSSRARPIVRCLCSTDCCVASPSCGTAGAVCVSSYVDRFSVATAASRDPSPAYPRRAQVSRRQD